MQWSDLLMENWQLTTRPLAPVYTGACWLMWGGVWGELAPKEKQNRVLCISKGVTKNRSRPFVRKKSRVHFHRRAFLTWIMEMIPHHTFILRLDLAHATCFI